MGCARNPALPFCRAHATKTVAVSSSEITEKDKQFSLPSTVMEFALSVNECATMYGRNECSLDDEKPAQFQIACGELRNEYVKVCALSGQHRTNAKEDEFCEAFENICFRIPKNEPDQATVPPEKKKRKRIDFTKFCREFKNRYLFVCPDPFRFGQKAVVFCPIYSERCHVPLPDRPVIPTRKPSTGRRTNAVDRICRSYRGFAEAYCNNPFTLSQPQYREGCEKYWRFCTRRHG
ncbi:unnamed protein product [Nippostrongylus brasiliensis]|uniref:Uncharacterized protein n=1 Tax=Nippostrongylus brasiliensis TaxID=27835 RepID=A0A0N4Y4U6_NIPBR|nr:unnamed protein product [Nippostrongylus brasiliensis]